MKMQITVVLSALLAAVAASPVIPVPAELEGRDWQCSPLGQICIAGNNCCSGKCDNPPDRQYGMPECVTEYTQHTK
ncbi:hypothetical protein LZ31DRAFT_548228 [Colletotrichum somersetense]|nr:hypothetical protein LZ31DRAFT_548228 [Colletotrichum somersetense]